MDANTLYIGVENLHSINNVDENVYFREIDKHPILDCSPDIIYFVHDEDYISTLKRLYL